MATKLKASQPEMFQFEIGSTDMQQQSIKSIGSEVRYDNGGFDSPSETQIFQPTVNEWDKFWGKIQELGIWQWNERIEGPNIKYQDGTFWNTSTLDGQSWSLRLKHGGKEISCSAHNAYPDVKSPNYGKTFKEFLEAIDRLLGKELFLIGPSDSKLKQKDVQSTLFKSFAPVFRYKIKDGEPIKEKVLNEELWEASEVVYCPSSYKLEQSAA